jgi:hypothetical protein
LLSVAGTSMRVQIDAGRLSVCGTAQNFQDFVTWESRELSGGVWRGKRVRALLTSKHEVHLDYLSATSIPTCYDHDELDDYL